jgi:fructuronate reductase
MGRFSNSALQHRTRQIAMDGSQKLPQRLLASLGERAARGQPFDVLALAVAAWMRWQSGRDDAGERFTVDDPMAAVTARAWASAGDAEGRMGALMAIAAIFPPELAARSEVRQALVRQLDLLDRRGARGAVEAAVQTITSSGPLA